MGASDAENVIRKKRLLQTAVVIVGFVPVLGAPSTGMMLALGWNCW